MKQIFTLCSAIVLPLTSVFSQGTSENFESVSSITALESKCWQFSNVNFQPAVNGSTINNSNNLSALSGDSYFYTPYVDLVSGSAISFKYKLDTKLNGGATKTINVMLLSYDGTYTPIGTTAVLNSSTSTTSVFTLSIPSPVTDTRKICVSIASSNNNSGPLYIDDMSFGGPLNYTNQYNCGMAASTLPIHVKSFQGQLTNGKAYLNWTVSDNETGNFFEILKSNDGKEFKTIAFVSTTQTTGDESYSYKDEISANAYYRLKLVNRGSQATYSNVLFIRKQAETASNLALLQNPVTNTLKFSFISESNGATEVSVYNMMGGKVYNASFHASKGVNLMTIQLDTQIKGGTYVLEVKNSTNRGIARFLKE